MDSLKNHEIKRRFVQREVYACVTSMVEYILKKSFEDSEAPFSWNDVENYYRDYSEEISSLKEKLDELNIELDELEGALESEEISEEEYEERKEELEEKINEIENEIEDLEAKQEETPEIYEWWIVSYWLGKKLKEYGEVVIYDGLDYIWGRQTTGQAIYLDYVIHKICEELKILEGQQNEWKVN